MSRLSVHPAAALPDQAAVVPIVATGRLRAESRVPLLIGIGDLAALLSRSVPSLHRDDAAGRLPAAVRLGGAKRWRYDEIAAWVEAGCPDRRTWDALRSAQRNGRRE